MFSDNPTIAAIATANGRGGVGIIRISGKLAAVIAEKLTQKKIPPARVASFCHFYKINNNEEIDSGILIYFPAPHSFTGEDIAELQIHGSPVALSMLLQECINAGAVLAQPGEFSKRAFINGKIDLTQAEAISDLISAESSAAVIGASASLRGEFSQKIEAICEQIIALRVVVEAGLDFAEEDISFIKINELNKQINEIYINLQKLSQQTNNGVILREGVRVVIAGAPNVGKSSLLNSLVGDDVAIVTNFPGTTRDTISQFILIDGITFHIIDTAGIRKTENEVEKIGIERSLAAINSADIVLHIQAFNEQGLVITDDKHTEQLLKLALILEGEDNFVKKIEIINKCDLMIDNKNHIDGSLDGKLLISVKNKIGLEKLKKVLIDSSGFSQNLENEHSVYIARTRHLLAITSALSHISQLQTMLKQNQNLLLEIIAEELILTHQDLQKITGEFFTEDLLGEIFGQFCIGK